MSNNCRHTSYETKHKHAYRGPSLLAVWICRSASIKIARPVMQQMEGHGEDEQAVAPAVADALLGALRGTVPKADMYLIKAAQSTT